MATLVLTAVGTAVGGPIGGALGALAGQAIDSRVLGRKGREGPRLTELAVQTSSYGTPIPQLFGTMRVAGTVIWATDLIEQASRSGGKGGGGGTSYSYAASFAVLLSARPIVAVRRIWADGKLLRGAAGDLKTAAKIRVHTGQGDAAPDPLIAAVAGLGRAPAMRGQAYAVFEELALADYGNRIPSLTFEVVADDGAVDCGAILDIASEGRVRGTSGTALIGYSAYGDTLRGIVDGLRAASGGWFSGDANGLTLVAGDGSAPELDDAGAGGTGRRARSMAAADTAPRVVTIQHHDPARDYQTGVQSARRAGAGGREQRIALPAVIAADDAKAMAAAMLARADLERERRTVKTDWRNLGLAPGARVRIAGEGGTWRVVFATLEAMVLTLELARIARAPVPRSATSGMVVPAPDVAIGTTVMHVVELPSVDDAVLSSPRVTVIAAGTGPGWRGANLELSIDGGISWSDAGTTRGRAVLGHVVSPASAGPSTLVDRVHAIEVELAHAGMMLFDADDAALDAGSNRAIVGDELVQFGRAERLGPVRWRLSELWRGRRGTEWASGTAVAGDRFALLDPAANATIDLPISALGGQVRVLAIGVGDDGVPATGEVTIDGRSVAPPAPVHLRYERDETGARLFRWTRRSRAGWHWIDGIDTALAEEAERYVISNVDGGDVATVGQPMIAVADLVGADPAGIAVRQVGTFVRSRTAMVDGSELGGSS